MITTAIVNQKGGVAKTTTSLNLGAGLIKRGKNVLFVDMDAQGNLTYSVNINKLNGNILDVLLKNSNINDCISEIMIGNSKSSLIASTSLLSGADSKISEVGKEYRLKEALEALNDKYDYCILDTPPSLGILTVNAMTAADNIVITAQADVYSLQGIANLASNVMAVREYCNKSLKIKGILLTRYNDRAIITRQITNMLESNAKELETKLFNTKIRENIAIKEAQAKKSDIFTYAPKSNGAIDYDKFIEEYLEA